MNDMWTEKDGLSHLNMLPNLLVALAEGNGSLRKYSETRYGLASVTYKIRIREYSLRLEDGTDVLYKVEEDGIQKLQETIKLNGKVAFERPNVINFENTFYEFNPRSKLDKLHEINKHEINKHEIKKFVDLG
ncbi:MAG TPA: hypothetical protein VJH34_01785 [archaeon]|nr:hypothetical protein [archaeon]